MPCASIMYCLDEFLDQNRHLEIFTGAKKEQKTTLISFSVPNSLKKWREKNQEKDPLHLKIITNKKNPYLGYR